MRYPLSAVALACALNVFAPSGQDASAAAAGFTLLYSADERGEITPCG